MRLIYINLSIMWKLFIANRHRCNCFIPAVASHNVLTKGFKRWNGRYRHGRITWRVDEHGKEDGKDALLRIFGTSANERLGGWSIIRANIQGCSTILLTISPNYYTLYLPHSPLFYFLLSSFSLALILRNHPSSSSVTITFPVNFLAIANWQRKHRWGR